MKFLVDECCEQALVEALRNAGYDVVYVVETLRGASDEVILTTAYIQDRIIITEDKDFGEIVIQSSPGQPEHIISWIASITPEIGTTSFAS